MNLLSTWAGLVDRMVTGRVRQVLQGTTLPPLHSWWDPPGEATICPNEAWSCPVTNSNRNCQEYVTAVEGGRGVKKRSTLQLCSEWVMWLACDSWMSHETCMWLVMKLTNFRLEGVSHVGWNRQCEVLLKGKAAALGVLCIGRCHCTQVLISPTEMTLRHLLYCFKQNPNLRCRSIKCCGMSLLYSV